ncbi:MAG: PAS domain S-box protein [Betaproteobacteria bacterium]|nr:PAS domain S-box protein [Betaproteobacteria bacterium]
MSIHPAGRGPVNGQVATGVPGDAGAPKWLAVAAVASAGAASLSSGWFFASSLAIAVALSAAGLIVHQRHARHALRASEERFRAFTALGSDWYWETDDQYRITHVSEGLPRLTGRPLTEFIGQRRWEKTFATPVGTDWTAHKAAIARQAPFRDLLVRYASPQGLVSYAHISGEPVFGRSGDFAGYRGVGRDVTAEVVLRQRMRMQHDVTRILGSALDTDEALAAVIETICRTMEWQWGAHRRVDPQTHVLSCGAHWLAPGVQAQDFVAATRLQMKARPHIGQISRVLAAAEIHWLADYSPAGGQRSAVVKAAGLRGAVFVPVRRGHVINDALEFFSKRVEAPDQVLIDTLDAIGREIGQFLEQRDARQLSSSLERQRSHLLEQLQLQLEVMPLPCILHDRNLKVLYCNRAAEEAFGYANDELFGLDAMDFLVPDHLREIVAERRARVREGALDVRGNNENLRKDGKTIICEWRNARITDESGRFAGILAVAQDITERTTMIAALEESEERYRQIFASTPLPMWVAEPINLRFLAVNDAMVEKYGYSRDELQRMTAIDLLVEDQRDFVMHQLIERDPHRLARFLRKHVTKEGEMLTVEITAQAFQFGGQTARLVVANDFTDRQRALSALEISEARLRAIFEQALVGIGIRDISMRPRLVKVNPRLCEILGYSEAELMGLSTLDITAPEDIDASARMNRELLSGEKDSYSRRKQYIRKDGRRIWTDLTVSRIRESSGEISQSYVLIVLQDVTERVQQEAMLIESEARYRQIFALTPLPMYLRDEETLRFIDVNRACHELYGYTREEMLGISLIDIQTPEGKARYLEQPYNRLIGSVERLQKQHQRRDGRRIEVEIHAYPTMLGGRKVRLVLVRDMSEQLKMERLVRDNERRLRAIADNVPAVIAYFADQESTQYINFAYDRWFGQGATCTAFIEEIQQLLELAFAGKEVAEERALETLGGRRVMRLTLLPQRGDNNVVEGVYLMGYDLTDFRRAEAEVRQLNAELEQRVEQRTRALAAANRELESFSYSVSHDLRAPLRTIDGFSQILIEEYSERLDDSGRGYLERVRAGSQRMARLIDDLLELARVTRRDLQIRSCDLTGMARDIVRELRQGSPGRAVRCEIADGMHVDADPGLLQIALDNLMRNAWKFTGLQAEPLIVVGMEPAETSMAFFVRDNGVGFDIAYANKLFGAFQRLHSESEFQGTGIGLALVQRVIRRHGGQVWARAEPGKGATFYFSLPPAFDS